MICEKFTYTYRMKWTGKEETFMEIENKWYEISALNNLLLKFVIIIFCRTCKIFNFLIMKTGQATLL